MIWYVYLNPNDTKKIASGIWE